MAAAGYGGDSIVWANVAQYGLRLVWLGAAVDRSLWFQPMRITWSKTREMFTFGFPLAVGNVAHFCSTSWDRLVVTKLFGTSVHGVYALGKSLSSVPADNIGDAVADVLMPSFVRMRPEEARIAVVRSCHLVAIIVYPMAAGLAAVSPTLVAALFNAEWAGIATPLTILAAVSLIDPMGDTMSSYLKARSMPWAVMVVQIAFLGVLLAATYLLGTYYGLYGACFGVGVGYFFRAMAALYAAHRYDQVPMLETLWGLFRVAVAAGLMAAAVVGVRTVLTSKVDNVLLSLAIEIAVGGIAFVPAAFLCANSIARDVLTWVRNRGGDDDDDGE
jgi:PST family polysaccharide transporter